MLFITKVTDVDGPYTRYSAEVSALPPDHADYDNYSMRIGRQSSNVDAVDCGITRLRNILAKAGVQVTVCE